MSGNAETVFFLDDAGWVWPVTGHEHNDGARAAQVSTQRVVQGLSQGQVQAVARGEGMVGHQRSPNADPRPCGCLPTLLVVHNISLPPDRFGGTDIHAFFNNTLDPDAHPYFQTIRSLRVSAHFLIARDGALTQFVCTLERAWHAGASSFAGRARCNDFAVGVELEGSDTTPFADAQYRTLAALTLSVLARHAVDAIVGHEDIAPGRKTDPGPHFDWRRYAGETGLAADRMPALLRPPLHPCHPSSAARP